MNYSPISIIVLASKRKARYHLLRSILLLILTPSLTQCQSPSKSESTMAEHKYTNALINETSPYLLQHAHNPVDWLPWGDEALAKAEKENKPLLISIGYSACHWCHVMEHESFEDISVAEIMNRDFVCIKVDREERPDVDQVYMDAVQLMSGRGGWPLNCFATPDGRPFFGGTYFPKDQWLSVLDQIKNAYTNNHAQIEEYADKLTTGLKTMDEVPLVEIPESFKKEELDELVTKWKERLDNKEGGAKGAPKFPIPNNYLFLLNFAHLNDDSELMNQVYLTLDKMHRGGINDQLGGGFARYSTDAHWKVPHVEKMLYDNAQMLSLYSEAYRLSKTPEYRRVILETAEFIERELTSPEFAFYSALDADSEGEEGKFYIWSKDDIKGVAGDNFDVVSEFFHIDSKGYWEHDNYILYRNDKANKIAEKAGLNEEELNDKIDDFKRDLMSLRDERIRPGLDDKSLTSWNAMCVKGLCDAYIATGEEKLLDLAKKNCSFLLNKQLKTDGTLWHSYKDGRSTINAYLEDYAFMIDALIRMYEASLDESYIIAARKLTIQVQEEFEQASSGLFYFKSKKDKELVAKKLETTDGVIPASNSVMASNFFKLGLLFGNETWIGISKQMLASISENFLRYPQGYSQWLLLHQSMSRSYYEVAIVGEDCEQKRKELTASFIPNVVICGGKNEGSLPILENRKVESKTLIYVCQNGACQMPTEDVSAALDLLKF